MWGLSPRVEGRPCKLALTHGFDQSFFGNKSSSSETRILPADGPPGKVPEFPRVPGLLKE